MTRLGCPDCPTAVETCDPEAYGLHRCLRTHKTAPLKRV